MNNEAKRTLPWRDILLPGYEVRKTKAQKERFISLVKESFDGRTAVSVENEGTLVKSRNIVLGDPGRADIIFTAHYDTCARLPFPNFITPMNMPVYLLTQTLLALLLLIPAFLIDILAASLTKSLIVTEVTLFAVYAAEMYLILAGPANPHTANDNTSGVAALLTLADELVGKYGDKTAFILFDNEEKGLLGSSAYAKRHGNVRDNGFLVNLDCVSDGDNILFSFKKAKKGSDAEHPSERLYEFARERAGEILAEYSKNAVVTKKAFYPSDQAAFRYGSAVAALKKTRRGMLYMDRIHTPRDTQFDETNIDAIVRFFTQYTAQAFTQNLTIEKEN